MGINKGEVALITGGASGIGLAVAESLISQGGRVIIADINEESAIKQVAKYNEKAGSTVAIAVKVDTTVWQQQVAAFEAGKKAFGRIDYVLANAGIAESPWLPPIFDPSTAASRPIAQPNYLTLNIDLIGQLNTAALGFQYFERQEIGENGFRGKVILTASVYGFWSCPPMPMYATAKSGVINFMRSTAAFYQSKHVTVNAIAPNLISTSIVPDPKFFEPFEHRKLLTPIELVVEQFNSVLGNSKTNGHAISINKSDVWVQDVHPVMREENEESIDLINAEIGKLVGWSKGA